VDVIIQELICSQTHRQVEKTDYWDCPMHWIDNKFLLHLSYVSHLSHFRNTKMQIVARRLYEKGKYGRFRIMEEIAVLW